MSKKTGKDVKDFYRESGNKGADTVRFGTANVKTFQKNLEKAKRSQDPSKTWRVTGMSRDELREWHPNAKLHVTDGGSTIAVDNGDIVGVCKSVNDSLSGSDLLGYAVKNGGKKLDSYSRNHGFYVKCGFEPVSWCKWDDQFSDSAKEQGWDPDRDEKEDIVFYRYVGKGNVRQESLQEFKDRVSASKDYDEAYAVRDEALRRAL